MHLLILSPFCIITECGLQKVKSQLYFAAESEVVTRYNVLLDFIRNLLCTHTQHAQCQSQEHCLLLCPGITAITDVLNNNGRTSWMIIQLLNHYTMWSLWTIILIPCVHIEQPTFLSCHIWREGNTKCKLQHTSQTHCLRASATKWEIEKLNE